MMTTMCLAFYALTMSGKVDNFHNASQCDVAFHLTRGAQGTFVDHLLMVVSEKLFSGTNFQRSFTASTISGVISSSTITNAHHLSKQKIQEPAVHETK